MVGGPDAGNPAEEAADHARRDLGPGAAVGMEAKLPSRQLAQREGNDGQAKGDK